MIHLNCVLSKIVKKINLLTYNAKIIMIKNMKYDAIIIGAGFSGLYQLHYLRDKLGLSVKIIDPPLIKCVIRTESPYT